MAILAGVLPASFVLPNSFYVDLAIRMAINAVIVLGSEPADRFCRPDQPRARRLSRHRCLRDRRIAHPFWLASLARDGRRVPWHRVRWRRWWPGRSSSSRGTIWRWRRSAWASSSISCAQRSALDRGPDGMPVPADGHCSASNLGDKHWYWICRAAAVGQRLGIAEPD
jgi:branched-chain amino acid transport system permease protein